MQDFPDGIGEEEELFFRAGGFGADAEIALAVGEPGGVVGAGEEFYGGVGDALDLVGLHLDNAQDIVVIEGVVEEQALIIRKV